MASLKLKLEYKDKLYYKKYAYKAHMKIPGVYWFIKKTKTLDDYKTYLKSYRYATKYYKDAELEAVISILQTINSNENLSVRIENSTLIIYGNDIDLLQNLAETVGVKVVYSKVEKIETGVIKFKNTPPAEYRIFFKGVTISVEEKEKLTQYIDSNDNIIPSSSTKSWLKREHYWLRNRQAWCSSTYNLNVNGEQNVTFLMLKYSDYLGKCFRLEKIEK